MKFEAILFDLWGTLADFQLPELERLAQEASSVIGKDRWSIVRQSFIDWHRLNIDHTEFMDRLLRQIDLSDEEQYLVENWISFDGFVLFPETIEVLSVLKMNGYKMALISNAPQSTKEQFENFGISKFFDSVCFSFELGVMKPDKKIFEHALTELNLTAKDCVMVGDSFDKDIMSAQSIGIKGVLIDRGNRDSELSEYAERITSLAELNGVLFNEV